MTTLDTYLDSWFGYASGGRALADALRGIAGACKQIAWLISDGPLGGDLGAAIGGNVQGEVQKDLDLRSNGLLVSACRRAPVFAIASEEMEEPLVCDPRAQLLVAIDPLDGSSNIEVNLSIGTIFSILHKPDGEADPKTMFLQPGRNQLAAGYILYGPQTTLVLTIGKGTSIFTLDRRVGDFVMTQSAVAIPPSADEFAINTSNARHWGEPVRRYVDACLAGRDGPHGRDMNMRWVASLVAECQRILMRGGVFLYPADGRPGYEEGRVRVLYEASPIAWIIAQAGGAAITGSEDVLDLVPRALHQRTPLIFGSREEVEVIRRCHAGPAAA
jgi:fructose-1,6-bisphosphatase I